MANLSLKHIYKVYPNGAKAVNDFNMQIEDKEFIVFVGPSGCGKSTTLRMIAGLEDITAGELKIGDMVVNGMEPKDRDIAMVFQNYALYPHMTIFENLAFGLRTRKIADIKRDKAGNPVLDKNGNEIPIMRKYTNAEITQKVNEAARILEITDYLKRKPKEMSGGQRQRVALGRAIVRRPKVMLLDEPLSNLDAKLRTQMRSEIVKLHKSLKTTFVYVTHDQVEAMTMGTRIVVMKDGFVKQIDTPKNLYLYPANKFVAGFIGTPQMNFFEGTLTRIGDEVRIDFLHSDASIIVPYSKLMKTTPKYLDGKTVVCIGFRAEDVIVDEKKASQCPAEIKVKISHSEELGTETLVYGDINMDGDGFNQTSTRVIMKTDGFREFESDTIREVGLNIDAIHLFDMETEESIMPRIPEYNYLTCSVADSKISFLGNTIALPPAIECENGKGELLVPVSAINFDGEIEASVVDCENIGGQILVSLDVNGNRLYALSNEIIQKGSVNIGIDFKKLVINVGNSHVEPMPLVNGLNGTFVMDKLVENAIVDSKPVKRKTTQYSLLINGTKLVAPEGIYTKMFAATTGRKVYNTSFRYEWSPYDFAIAKEGLPVKIEQVLDYGIEKFAKCKAGDETIYVKVAEDIADEDICILPNVAKVSVVESERQIRIV